MGYNHEDRARRTSSQIVLKTRSDKVKLKGTSVCVFGVFFFFFFFFFLHKTSKVYHVYYNFILGYICRTTQHLDLFDKYLHTMITISDISAAPFCM